MDLENLILIVDDREDDQLLLERMLRNLGVMNPIQTLSDGQEAVRYLKGDPPYSDRRKYPLPLVLFLDLKLPLFDGWQVLDWIYLHSQKTQSYIFIYTVLSSSEEIRTVYRLGANSLLHKPLREPDLLKLLQHFPKAWMMNEYSRSLANDLTYPP